MGAHYIMNKLDRELVAIVFDPTSKRIIMVLKGGKIVIVSLEQAVIVENDKRYNYDLLGWRMEGEECALFLGKCSGVVEVIVRVNTVKRTATTEVAGDCHIVVYFVNKDGKFYQKRYTSTHYYGDRTDKGTVHVGTLPLELLQVVAPSEES